MTVDQLIDEVTDPKAPKAVEFSERVRLLLALLWKDRQQVFELGCVPRDLIESGAVEVDYDAKDIDDPGRFSLTAAGRHEAQQLKNKIELHFGGESNGRKKFAKHWR